MTGKRVCAFILATAVIFVLVCSFVLTAAPVPHDCTGENCGICYRLDVYRKKAGTMVSAGSVGFAFMIVFCFLIFKLCCHFTVIQGVTPVSLKVKLTD